MSKIEVLQVAPLMKSVERVLQEKYHVHRFHETADADAFIARLSPAIRAIATNGHVGASGLTIESLPKLEIISCYGVGVDAIDLESARRHKVIVSNTPDVLNDDVANMAIVMLLAISRRLLYNDHYLRAGKWLSGDPVLANGIHGKKIGILGLGRIGKDIARKLEVFGCDICYHGRNPQPEQPWQYYESLEKMAATVKYLVVICPASDQTHHLVNETIINALGTDGTLINVARGSVVDEKALLGALEDGRLGAAALDVFADEPRVPESLFQMDNVLLQPHQGSATRETRQAMGDLMLENLRLHFDGKDVRTPVVAK